jgi:hypothetical protein
MCKFDHKNLITRSTENQASATLAGLISRDFAFIAVYANHFLFLSKEFYKTMIS